MIIPDQPNIFKATKDLSFGFNDIMIMNLPVPGTKKKKILPTTELATWAQGVFSGLR